MTVGHADLRRDKTNVKSQVGLTYETLFGEETVTVREAVLEDKKKELVAKGKLSKDFAGLNQS